MNNEPRNTKKTILLAVIFAAILLLGIVACLFAVFNSDETPDPSGESTGSTSNVDTSVPTSESTEDTAPVTVPTDETEPVEESTGATVPVTYPVAPPVNPPAPTQPPKTVLNLPYTIPGTSLVIQRIAPYSGIYLEDASNDQVTDVAMILLYNSGTEAVEYASITMTYDYGQLTFIASAIPAGAQVAVQESSRSGLVGGDLVSCTADVATILSLEMSDAQIQVTDNGDNSLTVTNVTDTDIVTVRIFYKYYYEDQSAYVGGITYTAKLSNLKAGETVTINPSHYSSDGSLVVMVRTYDTDA